MPSDNSPYPPRAAITAVATYVPDRVVTNAELATRLDTSDDWIVSRTGIRERRRGSPGETTSTMGAEAVRRLMAAARLGPGDVGALIVATVTPDMMFPATACLHPGSGRPARHLGIRSLARPAPAFSMPSPPARRSWRRACTGG